jgi:hypothetical protein
LLKVTAQAAQHSGELIGPLVEFAKGGLFEEFLSPGNV